MTNKYLEKIAAKQQEYDPKEASKSIATLEGLAAAYTLPKLPSKALGYHSVYHGTSKETKRAIRNQGIIPGKPAFNANNNAIHKTLSKRRIHVTKDLPTALAYAGHLDSGKSFESAALDGLRHGAVVKARIPHALWEKSFEEDVTHTMMAGPMSKEKGKSLAATSKHSIPSFMVSGGKGSHGASTYLHANHLRKYYGSLSGAKRGLSGIAMGGVGAAALVDMAKRIHNKFEPK